MCQLLLFGSSSARGNSQLHGSAKGDTIKPVPKEFRPSDGGCSTDEDKETGLERILSVVLVFQHPTADRQHHGTVPPHQGLECRFLLLDQERFEKLPIGYASGIS
jgi:hypothetical protein